MFGLHPSSWLGDPQTLGILGVTGATVSCAQFLKWLQSHEGEIGMLLLLTSPFMPQLG